MWQPWACAPKTSSTGSGPGQGPQLLCFEIHSLVCAKAVPRQWLRMGRRECHKADPCLGDKVLRCHTIMAHLPRGFAASFLDCTTVYNSPTQPSLPFSFTWDYTYIMVWWISQFCFDLGFGFAFHFLPISFHTSISPNKILACLVLPSYLLLR